MASSRLAFAKGVGCRGTKKGTPHELQQRIFIEVCHTTRAMIRHVKPQLPLPDEYFRIKKKKGILFYFPAR